MHVDGLHWEFLPPFPPQLIFWCFLVWFLHYQQLKQKPALSSASPKDPVEVGWRLEAGSSSGRRNFIRKA